MTEQFPIDLTELVLVRNKIYTQLCDVCKNTAPYSLIYLIDDPVQLINQGQTIVEFNTIWMDMVLRQLENDFSIRYQQNLCKLHSAEKLAIALGKVEPVVAMISNFDLDKSQKSISVFCSVVSFEDEGNTWIGIAPYAEIADIRKYLLEKKKKEGLK